MRKKIVDVEEIEMIVAKMARVPPKQVSASDKDVLRNLDRNLKMVIFVQDPAIDTLASAIKMARSGLAGSAVRTEEHTSELQSLLHRSYPVFCWKKRHQTRHTNA